MIYIQVSAEDNKMHSISTDNIVEVFALLHFHASPRLVFQTEVFLCPLCSFPGLCSEDAEMVLTSASLL